MFDGWCTLDIETATEESGSICQVGLVAWDWQGHEVEEYSVFSNVMPPGNIYDPKLVDYHGIPPEQTADSPTWDEVAEEIASLIPPTVPIIAHNASFEMGHFEGSEFRDIWCPTDEQIYCSMFMAQACFPGLERYKLGFLIEYFQLDYDKDQAHGARYDAICCGNLWMIMANNFNLNLEEMFDYYASIPINQAKPGTAQLDYLESLILSAPHELKVSSHHIGGGQWAVTLDGVTVETAPIPGGIPKGQEINAWIQNVPAYEASDAISYYKEIQPPSEKQIDYLYSLLRKAGGKDSSVAQITPLEQNYVEINVLGVVSTAHMSEIAEGNYENVWLESLNRSQASDAINALKNYGK